MRYFDDTAMVPDVIASLSAVLPEQLFFPPTLEAYCPSWGKLQRAVLQQAMRDYRRPFVLHNTRAVADWHEVDEWLHSDEEGIFSYRTICEGLGVNYKILRHALVHERGAQ